MSNVKMQTNQNLLTYIFKKKYTYNFQKLRIEKSSITNRKIVMQTKLSKVETRKADLANLAQNNLVFTYDNPRKMNHLPKKSKKIKKK